MGNYKRIFRSRSECVAAGLCGGVAEYFNVDPVLVRLMFVGVTVFTGFVLGPIAYVLGWIIVPQEPLPMPVGQQQPSPQPDSG